MKFWKKAALATMTSAVAVGTVSGLAKASTVSGGGKLYTQSSPEYVISDENTTLSNSPGHAVFTSTDNEPNGWWVSSYLVSGYSRGHTTYSLNGNQGKRNAFYIPAPLSGTSVASALNYSGSVTRPGWDLWLVPTSHSASDTTAAKMEADSSAVELMVQPGKSGGNISNPGKPYHQHRAYIAGWLSCRCERPDLQVGG